VANIKDVITQLDRIADSLTGSAEIAVPASSFLLGTTGAPLAVFADNAGASAPGIQINSSEWFGVRWNNFATQATIARAIRLPADLDTAYNMSVDFECGKVGATVGDATTITFSAFITKAGQLLTAGADVGGATGALVGNATSLTLSTLTRDISSANLVTYLGSGGPGTLHLAFKPSDGLLGTDDFLCSMVTLRYRRRSV
jgi:hypothetical protein